MASIIDGYEYDIFISYRHNDNKSGWVSEFVSALQAELDSTIKQSISIYFDKNPRDGLLETHRVDKSLEGKLKCLIFIPIISQTYCDQKSFAWRNEFCPFNKRAIEEQISRDIRLSNGNVASRVLPVKIHELDAEDNLILENELGSTLRSVDFIFKSAGVNRPLQFNDKREDNLNHFIYRDQVNKVAQAIKEIINAIRFPGRIEVAKNTENKSRDGLQSKEPGRSIAVLPFTNLSQDPSQEYFADGVTENILNQLASLRQLRVISRTSITRYKKTNLSAPEIAAELNVKYILEGSAQMHQNKVRIQTQLIDAEKDTHVWSKAFVENLDDIFAIQTKVSETVAHELLSSIGSQDQIDLNQSPTKNLEAYDLFLKGRHAFNQWGVEGYKTASDFFKKAIEKDPDFQQAYSFLASSYSARMSWNGDLSTSEAIPHIERFLNEAWKRGPTDNDYLTKAFIEFFARKNFEEAEKYFLEAINLNPNNAGAHYSYCYLLHMMGRFDEGKSILRKASVIEPFSVAYFNYQAISHYFSNEFAEAIATIKKALDMYPKVLRLYDLLARVHLSNGAYEQTIEAVQAGFSSSGMRPPSMVAYLAIADLKLKRHDQANELLSELIGRSKANEKGVNFYLVQIFNAAGDQTSAEEWLTKSKSTNDVDLIWWNVDPLLKNGRVQLLTKLGTRADYPAAEKHISALLESQMPKLPYHNIDHIQDVLNSVLEIAKNENLTANEIKLVRLAALFHDAGFIESSTNHEERGARMAKEILVQYGLSADEIQIIAGMILATRLPQSPATKLEKILCDADLDYLGREDFYRIEKKLHEEMKMNGIVETDREWNLVQKTFLESHKYHTEFSRKNREENKRIHLQEIINRVQRK